MVALTWVTTIATVVLARVPRLACPAVHWALRDKPAVAPGVYSALRDKPAVAPGAQRPTRVR